MKLAIPTGGVDAPDIWRCDASSPANPLHQWQYMGRRTQLYRCLLCAQYATKDRLRAETNVRRRESDA